MSDSITLIRAALEQLNALMLALPDHV